VSRFFGKYRGKVENNVDPQQLGRVQVSAPAVLGQGTLSWAMPCVPYAGSQVGLFLIPPVGASVWVEFEGGDPDYPIWSGCFWNTGDVPASPGVAAMKVLKTDAITLTLSDLSGGGGVKLEVNPPAVTGALKLTFDAGGIELSNGSQSVKLTQANVSINNGALEVM
jgi:Type VI secretion system/phage-baseplate injector OB domain